MKQIVNKYNPICGDYFIPDVEAHTFGGKLWCYGSLDMSEQHYCGSTYHAFCTEDFEHYEFYPDVFHVTDTHKPDAVILSAPDCIEKDGTYYLFYCLDDGSEGVATSDKPQGPFKNGKKIEGAMMIDPAIFVDDDGEVYFLWGQFSLKGARLKDMCKLDTDTFDDAILTEKEHFFHEGSSLRKINGTYYIIFADVSRGKPSPYGHTPTCLGYATSDKPLGPYTYRGVLVDNIGCDPATWNNHGSIEVYKGQPYVFYHKTTRNSISMRRACVEKISIAADGSIAEVKPSTEGAQDFVDGDEVLLPRHALDLAGEAYIADGTGLAEKIVRLSDSGFRFSNVRLDGHAAVILKGRGNATLSLRFGGKEIFAGAIRLASVNTKKIPLAALSGTGDVELRFSGDEGFEFYALHFVK